MSFLVRSLSRERARTGDLREGRNEVLRELIVGGPAGAAINWLALSQLLNMVQQKGSIPEVIRKILKDLLASDDLRTALQALTIVDMLALNCPEGKVRSQLAGQKWVKRLSAKAAAPVGHKQRCPDGLPAALAQLLANWALVFKGQELGGAAAQECRRLTGQGLMVPGPSDEALALGMEEATGLPLTDFLHGCDFARDFIPPQPLQLQGSEGVGGSSKEVAGLQDTEEEGGGGVVSLRTGDAVSASQPNKRHTVGPTNVRSAVLAKASLSPAFQNTRAHTMPNLQRAMAVLTRRSAEPVPKATAAASSSSRALRSASLDERNDHERAVQGGDVNGAATGDVGVDGISADAAAVADQLSAAVAETIAGIKRDKTALATADDACRAAVMRFNAGHKDAADTVMLRAEAGFKAALECAKWADRVQNLAAQNIPHELLSKMLEVNDLLTGQLRRWHAVLSNPVVQAALAGPSSPTSGPDVSRSPPRSMHLLDLPGVWSAPVRGDTRRATAPNTPCLDHAASEAAEPDPLPSSARRPCSSGRNPPTRTPSITSFNFVRHTRSASSPDNCAILDGTYSPVKVKERHTILNQHSNDAYTSAQAPSVPAATGAWELSFSERSKRKPTKSESQGSRIGRRVSQGAQLEPPKSHGRGVISAPSTVQDLSMFMQQQQQQQQQQGEEAAGLAPGPGSIRTDVMQRSQSGYSEGHTPGSAQQSANSVGLSTPFSEYWHSGAPSPGPSSRASSGALAMSRRVTWDHASPEQQATGSMQLGEQGKRVARASSATPESTLTSRGGTTAEVDYLKSQVDRLMEQLSEAVQAKTQVQQELLESHRARMAAELHVIELRTALDEERQAARQEAAALRETMESVQSASQAKQLELQRDQLKQASLEPQVVTDRETGRHMLELERANVGLQAELTRALELLKMKETGGDEAAGAVGYASSAGASLGPPAEASGTTPGLASGTLPVEVVSSPRVLSSGNAARVGDNPRQCRDSGKGSATAAEATSVVSGVVAMEDIERDTSSSPTFLDVGQLHGGQAEAEVQPPTPSLRLPFNSTPGDAAELRTHEGESSDDDTGLKAVLAYQIEPQPQSGGGLESSVVSPPAAAAIASSTRPDLLTLSPDNPFC